MGNFYAKINNYKYKPKNCYKSLVSILNTKYDDMNSLYSFLDDYFEDVDFEIKKDMLDFV